MVFSSTTFLFLFLPAVIFFCWFPDVCSKITQLFCKKSLDNQDQNLALYSQTANADSLAILADFRLKQPDTEILLSLYYSKQFVTKYEVYFLPLIFKQLLAIINFISHQIVFGIQRIGKSSIKEWLKL